MNEANEAALRRAEKKERKIKKITGRAFIVAGLGIGLFFLKFLIIPVLGLKDDPEIVQAISACSLYMIFYGAVLALVFIFKRDFVLKANLVMNYIVVPLIIMKLALDLM